MSSIKEKYNNAITLEEAIDYVADLCADSMWWCVRNDDRYRECEEKIEILTDALQRIFEIYDESCNELDDILNDKACDIYEQRYGN